MEGCLLSVDWDYFIRTQIDNGGSYLENNKNRINLWYKRYILCKARGTDIRKSYFLSPEVEIFWENIKKHFCFDNDVKAYVSDSHALSYDIAKKKGCRSVYLFDAHADLGYGGLPSLKFEVNCANWLGKLLKERMIKEADIVYSPYTAEKPELFKPFNKIYPIRYPDMNDLGAGIRVSAVHICRSGAWTPPWLDGKFTRFVQALGIPYKLINCPARKWDPANISFSDEIDYLMA